MAFVKLDTGILDSTLWIERDQREVFITALLMAEPREFAEPIHQIEIGELEYTDFVAPPGWYGFVPAASFGIINRAGVDRDAGMEALRKLGLPEIESRSKEHEGRRMIRMNGGFVILNYMKYRDKDHTAALRQARLRARKKAAEVTRDVNDVTRDDTLPVCNVTQSEGRGQRADNTSPSAGSNGEFMAATSLFEELGIAAGPYDIQMLAQVIAFAARDAHTDVDEARKYLLGAASVAKERGEVVNTFWFKDRKFAQENTNGRSGKGKRGVTGERLKNTRIALAQALAKRGVDVFGDAPRTDGAEVSEPRERRVDGGVSDRLRAVGPEILPPKS